MINESAAYFEGIAKELGLSVKIPRPSRAVKNKSALTNGLIGIGFMASGVLFRKMLLVMLGILGMAGAVLLVFDGQGESD